MGAAVLLLAVMLVPSVTHVSGMIEPMMDKARWWQPPSTSSARSGGAPPVTPVPRRAPGDARETAFVVAPPLGTNTPAYLASPHIVGPKPPPGYNFSAGPKPARFPYNPVTERTVAATPKSPATPPREPGLKHRWKKAQKRQGGANEIGKKGIRPSDRSVCGRLCPPFRLVERSARYDIRYYPRTLWVSYVTVTENRLLAEMEARAGISEFLAGQNGDGETLPKTVPFVTQLRYGRVPGRQRQDADFSISMPLLGTREHPRPQSNQLVVDYVSKQRVFVTSFWARDWKLTEKTLRLRAKRFIRKLRRHGHAFLDTYFYLAKYDGSFYEIWIYSTPFKSKRRFRPTGKPQMPRPTNRTLETMRRLCRGLECPLFEVLSEHRGGIQKRHYYNAVFATSRMDGCDSSIEAMWRGLMPLHLYRQGINSHLEVIEATRPIGALRVHEAVPGRSTGCNMTSLMYLPKRLHQNPPNTGPSAPPTSLAYVHDLHVYVATVGGFVLEPGRVEQEVALFRRQLDKIGLCYRPGEYFVAVYDFIQRYHGRLNEIWMVARHCRGSDVLNVVRLGCDVEF